VAGLLLLLASHVVHAEAVTLIGTSLNDQKQGGWNAITSTDDSSGATKQLVEGVKPASVLGATYDPAQHRFYIFDFYGELHWFDADTNTYNTTTNVMVDTGGCRYDNCFSEMRWSSRLDAIVAVAEGWKGASTVVVLDPHRLTPTGVGPTRYLSVEPATKDTFPNGYSMVEQSSAMDDASGVYYFALSPPSAGTRSYTTVLFAADLGKERLRQIPLSHGRAMPTAFAAVAGTSSLIAFDADAENLVVVDVDAGTVRPFAGGAALGGAPSQHSMVFVPDTGAVDVVITGKGDAAPVIRSASLATETLAPPVQLEHASRYLHVLP